MAAPVDTILAGKGGDTAFCIDDVKLPALAAFIAFNEDADDVLRALPLAKEPDAIDAIVGIDGCRGGDTADSGRDVRHTRANSEKPGCDRDSNLTGGFVAGNDRPGHQCLAFDIRELPRRLGREIR